MLWRKTLLAAAVAGLAAPVSAADPQPQVPAAEKPENEEPKVLDRIVIEATVGDDGLKAERQTGATKLPLSLRETPQSVSVITRESLDDRQVMTLSQALELSAGVTQFSGNGPFAGRPSFGFNRTTIRGFEIDNEYDFREDGFVNGSYFSIPDLAIYDSVEVIKGPNSVLYGRGSVGGLINRVRKRPLTEGRTELEVNAGSFDTYRAEVDTTGPLFGSERVRGRLVGVYDDSGSFVRGVDTKLTLIAPSVAFDITPHTRLLLQALQQKEDIIPNTGMPLKPVAFDGDGNPTRFAAPDISRRQYVGVLTKDPYTWTIESASAELEQDLGDQWLAKLRLNSNNIDTPMRVDGYAYGFEDGNTEILGNEFHIDRDVWSGELQLIGNLKLFGRAATVSFGADHNDNQYSRSGAYTEAIDADIYGDSFPSPDFSTLESGSGYRTRGTAKADGVYAQAHVRPTERLAVLLGLRYDKVDWQSWNNYAGDTDDKLSDVTGRIALTYDLSEQVSIYTLYAQSFQPALFDTDINGDPLEPETGEVYEAGLKTEWFAGRLGANAAIYRMDREHIPIGIAADPTDPESFPYAVSSGLQRAEGYEVEINGRLLPGWDLSVAYNRVDTDAKDGGLLTGSTPDWQLAIYSAYRLQAGALKGLGFGATYFSIDERDVGNEGALIPGYERVDLHASYDALPNVVINLVVRNLLDKRYIEGSDRSGAYATFGSPTAALLSLRYTLAH